MKVFYFMYMGIFVCMHVCVPCICLVLLETKDTRGLKLQTIVYPRN